MRIKIPGNLTGDELFKYLVENKAELIEKKKSLPIKSDDTFSIPEVSHLSVSKDGAIKAEGTASSEDTTDPNVVRVKVVGNAAWFCDSHMDVLTDKCYDQSILSKGNLIPHIKDHHWESDAHVGDVVRVFKQNVSLRKLGWDGDGKTACVIWETDVRKDYNERVFMFYKNKKINQHSLGLQYVSLDLCINSNDEDYEEYKKRWDKYYPKVINKELVDRMKYFWVVYEIKIIENSCVLAGANPYTTTLDVSESKGAETNVDKPLTSTSQQQSKKRINFGSLLNK